MRKLETNEMVEKVELDTWGSESIMDLIEVYGKTAELSYEHDYEYTSVFLSYIRPMTDKEIKKAKAKDIKNKEKARKNRERRKIKNATDKVTKDEQERKEYERLKKKFDKD